MEQGERGRYAMSEAKQGRYEGVALAGVGLTIRGHVILEGVSLDAAAGDVIALVGPNGAGKSSLMKVIAGLVPPSAGEGSVAGCTLGHAPYPHCGMMPEYPAFVDEYRGLKNLAMLAELSGIAPARLGGLMEAVGLDPALKTPVGAYSQGMRKRLALAAATMGDPDILLLDEPANGLDPEGVRILRRVVRDRAAQGCMVFISSHLLAELEEVCTKAYLVESGRVTPIAIEGERGYLERAYFHEME